MSTKDVGKQEVCVLEREQASGRERDRERKTVGLRQIEPEIVNVCERERERGAERDLKRTSQRERERDSERVHVCV